MLGVLMVSPNSIREKERKLDGRRKSKLAGVMKDAGYLLAEELSSLTKALRYNYILNHRSYQGSAENTPGCLNVSKSLLVSTLKGTGVSHEIFGLILSASTQLSLK